MRLFADGSEYAHTRIWRSSHLLSSHLLCHVLTIDEIDGAAIFDP